MEHQTLGRQVICPSEPAYYILDCRILEISVQKVLPVYQKLAHSSAKWAELIMAIQIIKFQAGDTKFEKLLPKNEGRRFDPF